MKQCCPYQRGGAIRGFAGPQWQVGGRFNFGRFIWRHAKPLLKFLGREALHTGVEIGKDVLSGQSIKEAARARGEEAGKNVARQALTTIEEKLDLKQRGSGPRKAPKRINRKHLTIKRRRQPRLKHLKDIFDRADIFDNAN